MEQSSLRRVLGAHLHEHLGPEGAKLHVACRVNQPVTRWVAKNVGSTEALEHVRSKTSPSTLFAAGIERSDPKWVDVHWRSLMRASLGYEPDDGSCRQPPNIALEEQSGWVPWSQEVRSSNSSLLARLSAARGPRTMPRELHLASPLAKRSALQEKEKQARQIQDGFCPKALCSTAASKVQRVAPGERITALLRARHREVSRGSKQGSAVPPGTPRSGPSAAPRGGRQHLHRVWHTEVSDPLCF